MKVFLLFILISINNSFQHLFISKNRYQYALKSAESDYKSVGLLSGINIESSSFYSDKYG
jgi:hypothetical protein